MTQVLLFSSDLILARGLESVLRQVGEFQLLPALNTVAALRELKPEFAPDVLLLDLTPEVSYSLLAELRHQLPKAKLVLWVNAIPTEVAFQAMELGIRGILRKTLPADLQVKCLQKVQSGDLWFEKALTDTFLSARRVTLTRREAQLVVLLAQGLKNKEIATTLRISDGTVKVYLSRLFQKVGAKDRFELALFGLKNLHSMDAMTASVEQPTLRSLVLDKLSDPMDSPRPAWPMVS